MTVCILPLAGSDRAGCETRLFCSVSQCPETLCAYGPLVPVAESSNSQLCRRREASYEMGEGKHTGKNYQTTVRARAEAVSIERQ